MNKCEPQKYLQKKLHMSQEFNLLVKILNIICNIFCGKSKIEMFNIIYL